MKGHAFLFSGPGGRVRTLEKTIHPKSPNPPPSNKKRTFPKLCTRKTEFALEVKFYLDFHRVTQPWRRTLTNGSDVKYVFPRCLVGRSVLQSIDSLIPNQPVVLFIFLSVVANDEPQTRECVKNRFFYKFNNSSTGFSGILSEFHIA